MRRRMAAAMRNRPVPASAPPTGPERKQASSRLIPASAWCHLSPRDRHQGVRRNHWRTQPSRELRPLTSGCWRGEECHRRASGKQYQPERNTSRCVRADPAPPLRQHGHRDHCAPTFQPPELFLANLQPGLARSGVFQPGRHHWNGDEPAGDRTCQLGWASQECGSDQRDEHPTKALERNSVDWDRAHRVGKGAHADRFTQSAQA